MNKKLNKLSCLFLAAAFLSSQSLYASDGRTLDQKLAGLKLEYIQAEAMIKKMVMKGRLSEAQALNARRSIASQKEEDLREVRAEAIEELKTIKSVATK